MPKTVDLMSPAVRQLMQHTACIPTVQPFATKLQAERYADALSECRRMLVAEHRRLSRVRKPIIGHAQTVANVSARYRAIAELHEAIQQAHGIGGY